MDSAYAWNSARPYGIYSQLVSIWLVATIAFGVGAAAVAAMFGVDAYRGRRGGALRLPPLPVLFAGIGLFGFGIIAIARGQGESYGKAPAGMGTALIVAYVAAALVVFAVGFLGYRPSPRPIDRWTRVLAAAHGLMGMGWGFALGLVTVLPPIVAT